MRNVLTTIVLLVAGVFVFAACQPTGDAETDANSAQTLQPRVAGFQATEADSVSQQFTNTLVASAAVTGNAPLAAALERAGTTINCLEEAGAISGNIYQQTQNVQVVPQGGASLIINTDRVANNLLNCVTEQPFSAQQLTLEPCAEIGTFTRDGDNFVYAYVAAGNEICAAFNTHFRTNLNAVPSASTRG